MPRTEKKYAKKGGSAASDAVEALVDPRAWPVLDARFTDAVGGSVANKKKTGGAGKTCSHTGGGCGCNKSKGGSVPASVPVGANAFGPLDRHSGETRLSAAMPNVVTFPPIRAPKYGAPSGGAPKPKPKAKSTPSIVKKVAYKKKTATKAEGHKKSAPKKKSSAR